MLNYQQHEKLANKFLSIELKNRMKKERVIQEKGFQFSLKVIAFYKILVAQNEFVISKQLLRQQLALVQTLRKLQRLLLKKILLIKCQSPLEKQENQNTG